MTASKGSFALAPRLSSGRVPNLPEIVRLVCKAWKPYIPLDPLSCTQPEFPDWIFKWIWTLGVLDVFKSFSWLRQGFRLAMPLGNTIYAEGEEEEGCQGSLMNQTVVWVQKPLNYYVTVKREYQSKTNNAIASPGLEIWRLKEGSLFHFKKSIVLIIDSFSSVFHCWSYPLSLHNQQSQK